MHRKVSLLLKLDLELRELQRRWAVVMKRKTRVMNVMKWRP